MRSVLKNKNGKNALLTTVLVVAVIAGVIFSLGQLGLLGGLGLTKQTAFEQTELPQDNAGSTSNPAVNPTATYQTFDQYATTSISGTAYYKRDGESYSSTAISNVNPGTEYSYWVENSTYYVMPYTFNAGTLNNNIVNKLVLQNGSATIAVYDNLGAQTVTSGKQNISGAASTTVNVDIKYTGTSKKSAMPYGGLLIIETNSTFTPGNIVCDGDVVMPNSGKYHLTWTSADTSHSYKVYEIAGSTVTTDATGRKKLTGGIDDGTGKTKVITCSMQNTATAAGATSSWIVAFIPANYYVANDNQVYLDTEKFMSDASTRTGLQKPMATMYWAA